MRESPIIVQDVKILLSLVAFRSPRSSNWTYGFSTRMGKEVSEEKKSMSWCFITEKDPGEITDGLQFLSANSSANKYSRV